MVFDYGIIGGGPAGYTTAMLLVKNGFTGIPLDIDGYVGVTYANAEGKFYTFTVGSTKLYDDFTIFTKEVLEPIMATRFPGYVENSFTGYSYKKAHINGNDAIYLTFDRAVNGKT